MPIFQSCERWHTGICRNELIRNTFFPEESIASIPDPGDLTELNRVCTSCVVPLVIQNRECPVCGGHVLQDADIPLIEIIGSLKIYNYRCTECKRELFAYSFV
jgi:hypothetical protein